MIPHETPTDKDFLTAHRIESLPKIDHQGIRFGFFWISWDRLVGWDGEDGEARKTFWKTSIFAKNLQDWIKQYQAAFGEVVLNPKSPDAEKPVAHDEMVHALRVAKEALEFAGYHPNSTALSAIIPALAKAEAR